VKWVEVALNPPEWARADLKNAQNQVIGWKAKVKLVFQAWCTDDNWHEIADPESTGYWVYHYN
jgi:hypothetical protein